MIPAIYAAKYFIKSNTSTRKGVPKGNIKLQKLLYFAQLFSLTQYHHELFKSPIFAFKHGMVIEDVRQQYNRNYNFIVKLPPRKLSKEDQHSLSIISKFFGSLSAHELSSITHQLGDWKINYNRGIQRNSNGTIFHNKKQSKVSLQDISKYSVPYMNNVILSIKKSQSKKDEDKRLSKHIIIDGKYFSFDPDNIDESSIRNYVNNHRNIPRGSYTIFKKNKEVIMY